MIDRLTRIRDRIASGIPLEEPIDDVRFLLDLLRDIGQVYECETTGFDDPDDYWPHGFTVAEMVTASSLPPRRKRCTRCNADGVSSYGVSVESCHLCNGTGYTEAP